MFKAVDRRDIEAFVRRDWGLVAEAKEVYWAERKRSLGPVEGLRVADELRRQTIATRPDFPTPEDRAADLESHMRLAEMLRRVAERQRG